jgi:glycosyltransferase involved in cell wall biosynthesis
LLSIIVPAHNSAAYLPECLAALAQSCSDSSEIIVVDDASDDDTAAVAAQLGVRVLRLARNSGPAAARNHGARHARGDILFFVDADVIVAENAAAKVVKTFAQDSGLAAAFGSYDASPRAEGLVSQYRNLLHHFVHQTGNTDASTFWAGCGAIRRTVFEDLGGFDEKRFPKPTIEDIELGYRLRQKGYRIFLDKTLLCTHLKAWNLSLLLRTDIVRRALPWSRLIAETKQRPNDLNLKWDQRLSFALVSIALVSFVFAALKPQLLLLTLGAFSAVVVINRRLYGFFARQRGWLFAASCILLHLLYYAYSGFTYVYVAIEYRLRKCTSSWLPARSEPS